MTHFGAIGTWQTITILFILLVGIIPTIVALIDILKNKFKGNNKLIWVLVVLLFNFFGAIIYFLIGKEQKIQA
ncbi:PLD nuclease N-terminal domain-containing protein [Algibacter sp. R77976]|uniref:PLD nuclease N-terminal domain-containing protein n=1 Tax=Algibacter sp. R77976 TaxID=3093873 RepID=UPI0037CA7040